jgi:hypothetical protein
MILTNAFAKSTEYFALRKHCTASQYMLVRSITISIRVFLVMGIILIAFKCPMVIMKMCRSHKNGIKLICLALVEFTALEK